MPACIETQLARRAHVVANVAIYFVFAYFYELKNITIEPQEVARRAGANPGFGESVDYTEPGGRVTASRGS